MVTTSNSWIVGPRCFNGGAPMTVDIGACGQLSTTLRGKAGLHHSFMERLGKSKHLVKNCLKETSLRMRET